MQLEVLPTVQAIAEKAAQVFIHEARKAISQRGVCAIALSGGSTPKRLYELLASEEWKHKIDWHKVHFFMGDERYVPHDDERSNQKLAEDYLLSKVPVDRTKVHVVHTHLPIEEAAQSYEQQIRKIITTANAVPQFDMILLGLGSDGHTASLFPEKPALNETHKLVATSEPGVLPPPVQRVTFTLPLINQARCVIFMAAGADKVEAFRQVKSDLLHRANEAKAPAGGVQPDNGELLWLIDEALNNAAKDNFN